MTSTITAEERANQVAHAIMEYLFVDGETVSVDVMNPASSTIAAAIRCAEDAAYERAAAEIEILGFGGGEQGSWHDGFDHCKAYALRVVNSFKSPSPPKDQGHE